MIDISIDISNDKWKVSSDPPSLKEGDVDLWRVDLDRVTTSGSPLLALLSDDEKQRAQKYVFERDRRHFIAGRGTLRKIVGGYLRKAPETIGFSFRQYGKPYLSAGDHGLRFNVSHSQGIALIAISFMREVGVDIEFVDRNVDVLSVAQKVFSRLEASRMRSLPSNVRASAFFARWTRQEAFLKATGDGLSSSEELQSAASSIRDEDFSFRTCENGKRTKWSLISFGIRDFKAALVVEGSVGKIRFWQFAEGNVPNARGVVC